MGYKPRIFLEMVKFEHTVFALPFAYLGALLAANGLPSARQFIWITLAMVGARTAAMSLNRLIDRHIDARNPRTAGRALPRGLMSVAEVWVYILLSFTLLLVSASQLNIMCVRLMPIAVVVLAVYSYTKRWTWACHFVLGLADALAPLGAWVAITGSIDLPGVLLGAAVGLWVGGFDIIYACQDYEFDRAQGIHSIPARFGMRIALWVARLMHFTATAALAVAGILMGFGLFYWTGVLTAAGLLFYEHRLISPQDLSRLGMAFLNVNGYISLSMFFFTLLEILFS